MNALGLNLAPSMNRANTWLPKCVYRVQAAWPESLQGGDPSFFCFCSCLLSKCILILILMKFEESG